MPYEIKKQKTGYKVCKKNTDKCFSKKPIPKINAIKQKYAIELHESSKTGGNYPEGFKKYSFIIRPKIGSGYLQCEEGWKTYPLTCQKDLECQFDIKRMFSGLNPFMCNDGPKTKARPTDGRNEVEDWWWNFKKDLERIFNTRCHEAGDGTTYCSQQDGNMADIPGEAYDILVPPEWKKLVDDLGKTIKGSETVLVNWLRDHKMGIFVDEWNKYIYEPLRDTIFNESWWTNVYRNMSLGDLLLLTLSVVLPFGDVPGIVLWAAIDTIKAVTEGGTGLQQMGDFFIALAKLPFPFSTIAKTVFDTIENAIESGFKQMTEINAKDMFDDMNDQINKMMERFPKARGDMTIPKPSKMLDLAGKINHVKELVDKLNDKYNGYKSNIIPSPEAYSQAIKPLAEELMNSSRIFKDETYHITLDLGKLKDPILNQTIINGYNQYKKENRPVDTGDDFREGEGKKGRGKKGKKKGKGDEIDTDDEEEDEDLKKRMISLDLDEEEEEEKDKYDIVTMKMKNTAYKAYENYFKKYLKNYDLKLTRRKFFDYYTIVKYKSLKEDIKINISQLILILHRKLFLKYIENANDEDVDNENYIGERITKFIDEVRKDLKKEGWSEDDDSDIIYDEDEEDEFTQQYKISFINRDGTPELFVNDDAFNENESKDVMNAYEYFKSEIEKQISDGDLRNPNIKGFIIDKKKKSGHSDSLISSIVRGAIYIVDKLPPDLGTRWCYSKSGSDDDGYNFNLDAASDSYQSFGIVLRLIDDEIQFCSMACIQQNSSENLYISYLCSWKYAFRLFEEIKRLFQSKSETCGKLDQVSLSSVSECDTVNFYTNQGMFIKESKLEQIRKDALIYLKKLIETEDKKKITDLKNSFSGNKPDKLCNIKNIEDVFNACEAGGGKYLFSEGMRDDYISFDLFYLMRDEILPNLEELLKDFEDEDEDEEEEKEDFYYFPDDEKETKKYFKQYEKFVNEHSELGIGSYPYDYFKEQFRIIKNMLILENLDYDITVILKIIHDDDIKESVLPDSKIKITRRNIDDIIDKLELWNNGQLNFIELSKAEGSGIKGKKFFEELKKYGIDPDDYLIGVKATAKKNKYDPKLIDWAYDDVHKLKYFSPEGVKKFGRVGYKDNFIYKHLEKKKEVEKGTAKKMRDRFHKSHEAITKKNDLSVYSPNELSLNILW